MTKPKDIPVFTEFPLDPRAEHPEDAKIRPLFIGNVMSAVSHATVVRTVDMYRKPFLTALQGKLGEQVRRAATPAKDPEYQPERHAISALNDSHYVLRRSIVDTVPGLWNTLTPRQQTAARRFTSVVDSMEDRFIYGQTSTITEAISLIHRRHPELELQNAANLTMFLRNPHTPGLLGGFMAGGNAFFDSMIGVNSHPAGYPWRADRKAPVLDTSGEQPQVSPEVVRRARFSRKRNTTLTNEELSDFVINRPSMRYSRGCPVLHVVFHTDNEILTANKLTLTSSQVEALDTKKQPIVRRAGTHKYYIVRNGLSAVTNVLADGLELLAK